MICVVFTACAKVTASQPIQMTSELRAIHFSTGKHSIPLSELVQLEQNSLWMQANRSAVVLLAGHADERGGETRNVRLGDMRAREIKCRLIASGVNPEQLTEVISYGEQRPVDRRHCEAAWKENRRVEFILR